MPRRDSFEFKKRSQLFFRSYNETLPIIAMRVNNPDRARPETAGGRPVHAFFGLSGVRRKE
jgi:hypothetical protein